MERCIICSKSSTGLSQCKDAESWERLYCAAVIRKHKAILDFSSGKNEFPVAPVKYHITCRKDFVNQKSLQAISEKVSSDGTSQDQPAPRRSARDPAQAVLPAVLPVLCIFCNKAKYKSGTRTRETLRSAEEFRDATVRKGANLHLQYQTDMTSVAQKITGICAKDLISSEAKYRPSCYRAFTRIVYTTHEKGVTQGSAQDDDGDMIKSLHDSVFSFCEELISDPKVIEFKEIRKVMSDKANKLGISVSQSQYKNLLRSVSNKFQELEFMNYQQNKVLVYPCTLKIENLIVENFELKLQCGLESAASDDNEKKVIGVAKCLNLAIKNHKVEMSWPPEEKDLEPEKVKSFIPDMLDTFCTVLVSGKPLDHDKSKSSRTIRLKNSLSQDIVYAASNGAIRPPKSVLFPAVVKAICNNTEIVKLINKCGHGISYNLVEEIETEFALKVINKQALNRVLIPDKCIGDENTPVALMIAENIDNLECTVTGAGTSHRVNSILVLKQKVKEVEATIENAVDEREGLPPAKWKCRRALSTDVVVKVIPDYYCCRRVGPGLLSHIQYLGIHSSYATLAKKLRMQYLIWVELRKLRTHPLLLVPGWTGFHIQIRDKIVVESKIGTRHS